MEKIIRNKKIVLFSLGTIFFVSLFIIPHFAGAQTSIITDAAVGIFVTAFKVFAYILNTILGFLFMLAGGLVNIAMDLNAKILDKTNTLVSIGWTITRDVANLGFVLIMIVMAVATIVRYEKYSVQKLLPLLIGAAILVNFSLTIAGVFISFSDTVSKVFLKRLVVEGATGRNLTDAIAGAFSPQRLLMKNTDNPEPPDPASQGNFLSDVSAAALISISGLVFNVIFMAIAVISMAALALMLLYRYIYLSFLLILSPLAWMFWVFPDLEYLYKKWWENFIKWCFFLPAVTFFLYLAVETAFQMEKNSIFINATGFTGALTSIMQQGAQMIVLAGLLLGGLIVAQTLGIKGAEGSMKLAAKMGEGARSMAGRKALQYGSYALRRKGEKPDSKSAAEWLVDKAKSVKIPVVKQAVGYLARGATRISTAGGEDILKGHDSAVSKMSTADATAALLTASGPRRIALVKKLSKEKQLGNLDMGEIINGGTRSLFTRFNQGREFGDVEKNGLMTVDMMEALKNNNEEGLQIATDKLVGSMTRKDLETAAVKDLFSGKKKFGFEINDVKNLAQNFARALESENPALVPSMIPKFDSPSRKNFTDTYNDVLDESLKMATPGSPAYDEIKKMKKQFDTVLANYTMGFSPVEETSGGGTTASTPPPSGGAPKP